jgi:site-specific DNA recombinase
VRSSLEAFCYRISSRLDQASFADKQAILQLVIERIIVGDGSLEIRHVIPLSPGAPSGSGNPASQPQLRSDGVEEILHAIAGFGTAFLAACWRLPA